MLNTFMEHEMIESISSNPNNTREKPASVLKYNATMGAVDNVDRITRAYPSVRKSYKWYKKVAFSLIDIAIYNSNKLFNSFRITSEQQTYEEYVRGMIKSILMKYPAPQTNLGRPRQNRDPRRDGMNHWARNVLKNSKKIYSDCHLCALYGRRKGTAVECSKCKKRLCNDGEVTCFEKFHTMLNLPKSRRSNGLPIRQPLSVHNSQASPPNTDSERSSTAGSISLLATTAFTINASESSREIFNSSGSDEELFDV